MLDTLNPPQREAVTTTEGPVLVLAGAGSGKTRVLTYRMFYLLKKNIARPENILAVTFTNKAAGEMKDRIASLLQSSGSAMYNLPWVGTFHSICVRLLKANAEHIGLSREFTIYDRADQLDAVKEVMKKLQMDTKNIKPNAVLNYISSAKSELIPASRYPEYAVGYFQDRVAEVYPEYQKLLRSNSAVDFDDLIMEAVRLLEQEGDLLEKYRTLFTHIMVDEYQDTNHAQYRLIQMLAERHKNICVVGDDAQSIYSFRGATIQNILNFEKDYPDAKVIKLEQNYRSTKTILDASNLVIALNPNQKKKQLWTENHSGEPITVYEALDEKDEADWVAKKSRN
ncbi:MAG: ATP-dependent DNA helicase PcrA [candidate division WS6 bacterium OLB20]|uniref:DNA 3'-5' helicase n=1 Tax=candidate division WS6 bacterium OLB20 TaxID=1617426 RepID=A0A136LZA2_9BACT|nr:MAG: ATP-dependent DNA helicase PcrA [candidate division WS6 bacterium OLB20]